MLYYNDHNECTSRLIISGDIAEIMGMGNVQLSTAAEDADMPLVEYANSQAYGFEFTDSPIYPSAE